MYLQKQLMLTLQLQWSWNSLSKREGGWQPSPQKHVTLSDSLILNAPISKGDVDGLLWMSAGWRSDPKILQSPHIKLEYTAFGWCTGGDETGNGVLNLRRFGDGVSNEPANIDRSNEFGVLIHKGFSLPEGLGEFPSRWLSPDWLDIIQEDFLLLLRPDDAESKSSGITPFERENFDALRVGVRQIGDSSAIQPFNFCTSSFDNGWFLMGLFWSNSISIF